MALAAYATESDIPILSATQLDLAEKYVIATLFLIDEINNLLPADCTLVSFIVKMLIKTLE